MATYAEQIAQWRVQRQQQEIADRAQQIQQEHAQAARERDTAIANNDMEEAGYQDNVCVDLEKEYNKIVPQQPQVHPQWMNWLRRNSTFIEREGDRAVAAVTGALGYMQRPRNPNSNDPRYTGMGMRPEQIFTKQGLSKLEDLLQVHGQQFFNVRYDPNEKALTPNAAAKISGLSPKQYNEASRILANQGRFSFQNERK